MGVTVLRRRFTVEEYHEMGRAGILKADDRVELIEGEIIEMSPIGSRHAACVDRLTQHLVTSVKGRAIVRVQNPLRIGLRSEPQPDLVLLKPKDDFYASGHPGPGDVLLLIEVASEPGEPALEDKLKLYARGGVAEVWVVDLAKAQIEVRRDPRGDAYLSLRTVPRGSSASPAALADLQVSVDGLGL